jgi:pilus assembly protein CpaB
VNGADSRALAGTRTVHVYIVKAQIPSDTPASALQPYLQAKDIPAVAAVQGRVLSLSSLEGLATNSAIEPGEQLLQARFSKPKQSTADAALPAGTQAVTVKLPLEQAVGGSLLAGDHVSVVIAGEQKAQQKLHNVQVLSVQPGDTTVPKTAGGTTAPVNVEMVTLALKGDAVTALVWGQKFGAIWLSKETSATPTQSGPTVSGVSTSGDSAKVNP